MKSSFFLFFIATLALSNLISSLASPLRPPTLHHCFDISRPSLIRCQAGTC
jgi:hypothetical protein